MNYRHAYHAGNFADVIKHATLALVIEHLKLKPSPFRVIDTHAGRGRYDLHGTEPSKTREWEAGIGRLLAEPLPRAIEQLLQPYLGAVAALNPEPLSATTIRTYPGSPLVARHLLRPIDKLVVNELHPEDASALAEAFAHDPQTKMHELDAWIALKAALPPPERRGVALIDPPFEAPGEFQRIVQGLKEASRRFERGIVLVWYPIKDAQAVDRFRGELRDSGLHKLLDVTLMVRVPDGSGLAGSGLVVANPPFGLDAKLDRLGRFLAERLAVGEGASSCVRWLVPERLR